MSRVIMIDVDWQPIETAPKDGREIMILSISGGFHESTPRRGISKCFWGVMSYYPDLGEMWVDVNTPGSGSLPSDEPFTREVFYYNGPGCVGVEYLYRGFKATHWAEPWDVEVEKPALEKITYEDKILVDERPKS